MPQKRILCINSGGRGSLDDLRVRRLASFLRDAEITFFDIDKGSRGKSGGDLWRLIGSHPWDLIYQEGTGITGGVAAIRAARVKGARYVVSVGDPVSNFFRVTRGAFYAAPFSLYEQQLYRASAGVVGWTPYLVGRALTLGAPRAVTIEGAVDTQIFREFTAVEKRAARDRFGLAHDHVVCGIVGSLIWVGRQQYCYGLDLIETLKRVTRGDISLLIVGDGDGRARLETLVPPALRDRVRFTGRLSPDDVVAAMNAMDIGFITQTLDDLGSFRLTTKMPEYLACGLPIAMSPTPGYYDYIGAAAGWALPPFHPASAPFHEGCARWLDGLDRDEIVSKSASCRQIACERFAYEVLGVRFAQFVQALLD